MNLMNIFIMIKLICLIKEFIYLKLLIIENIIIIFNIDFLNEKINKKYDMNVLIVKKFILIQMNILII